MTSAVASIGSNLDEIESSPRLLGGGAQSLLAPERGRPSYVTQGVAVGLYALALAAAFTYTTRPQQPAEEDALELVMLPPAVQEPPVEEPPPVAEETPPEPIEEPELAPPIAEEPPVAPVVPKPPPKPKPKPVQHKPVDHKPAPEQPRHAQQTPAPPRAAPPPQAVPSGYFNQVSSRVARAAQSTRPTAALARHESGRVGYRIVISPSGAVISVSVSSSGHPDLDAAARQALARAAPFPAYGGTRPVAVSGGIQYR